MREWRVGNGRRFGLDGPVLMGVLNVTPDSFSDGGSYLDAGRAAARARAMASEGAHIIDIGGESTRPGAARVSAEDQIARVVPVVRALRADAGFREVAISVDTTLAHVARAVSDEGADIVNDVSAGTEDSSLLPLAAERSLGVILMHRLRPPGEDTYSDRYPRPPAYSDVRAEVGGFLRQRVTQAMASGIQECAIAIDPGLGFGKDVAQNLQLIAPPADVAGLGLPVVSALSLKSFVGSVMCGGGGNIPPSDRLPGTLALSVLHRIAGASVFRVHDVAQTLGALRAADAARSVWTR